LSLADPKKKSVNRLTVTRVAANKYWVPPFPINLDASGLRDAYDEACIKHTSSRSHLSRMLKAIARKRHLGRRNRKAEARIKLSRRKDFFEFWVNQREFCKKRVKGVLPFERAMKAFFAENFSNETSVLIRKLSKHDEKVIVDGKKRSRFIVELAKWSVSTKTARCPCLDIGVAIQTGKLPDGKRNKWLREKYRHSWRNYQLAKQTMCLEMYPGICQLTPRGKALIESGDMISMKASLATGFPKKAMPGK
jgi:hypothetical protein